MWSRKAPIIFVMSVCLSAPACIIWAFIGRPLVEFYTGNFYENCSENYCLVKIWHKKHRATCMSTWVFFIADIDIFSSSMRCCDSVATVVRRRRQKCFALRAFPVLLCIDSDRCMTSNTERDSSCGCFCPGTRRRTAVLYELKFSRRQNSITFSRADSNVRWFINSNVSETNSISIIRAMRCSTRLSARENF